MRLRHGIIILALFVTAFIIIAAPSEKSSAATGNLALGKMAYSSSNEVDFFGPEKAVDGGTQNASRWSSERTDDQWFYVDLGEPAEIGRVVINWQTPAEKYQILVSDDAESWRNVFADNRVLTAPGPVQDTIDFEPTVAQYVKFQGVTRRPIEGVYYGYSFWEFEVYKGRALLPPMMEGVKSSIAVSEGDAHLNLPAVPAGFTLSLVNTDSLPVIDAQGNIHAPLVDTQVQLLLQIQSDSDPAYLLTDNALVTVPGLNKQTSDRNPEPRVIPSLREWLGATGEFRLTDQSKIVISEEDEAALRGTAGILQQELLDLTKLPLTVTAGSPGAGDIYLALDAAQAELGTEGYELNIGEYASVAASDGRGVMFGTRTILQLLGHAADHKAMPKGQTRDYPKYPDRGFMLDVARKFYTIEFLQDYVKLMSYYKMNRLQIHLNDDVGDVGYFRLESEKFPGITSKDGFYTKQQFRELQLLGMEYGVNVVPEIDTPGHSGAFIAYDSRLGSNNQLDINRSETIEFIKALFDEYLDGSDPTFVGPDVHVGTDEYFGSDKEAFRRYADMLLNHINGKGKRARLWGSLSAYDGTTPVSNNATMDIWYEPYGSAKQAVELGYDIINTNTNLLYIVPQLYRNYLSYDFIYNEWEPNDWLETKLPYAHPQVKGGMFALWNDVSVEKGVSMADSHQRILPSMQVLAEKLWRGNRIDRDFASFQADAARYGDPPGVHQSHKLQVGNERHIVLDYTFDEGFADRSGNGFDGNAVNASAEKGIFGQAVRLKGGASYVETPLRTLGFGWTMSMWIKPDADNPQGAVLLESPDGALKYNIGGSGKIAITKENYVSEFNYKLPTDRWTHVIIAGDDTGTSIFIDGSEYTAALKDGSKLETFVLPVAKIGSATNAFKGLIDELVIRNTYVDLHGNLALHKQAESSQPESSSYTADKAVDGRGDTRWSSDWVDDSWFMVDLGEVKNIDAVSILWQTAYGSKYRIFVSEDKVNWTNVVKDNNGEINGKPGRVVTTFQSTPARFVKFEGVSRATIFGYSFEEFEVYGEEYKLGNIRPIIDLLMSIEADKLAEANYSPEGWAQLQQAMRQAMAAIQTAQPSRPEAEQAYAGLSVARDRLTIEDVMDLIELNVDGSIVSNLYLPQKGQLGTRIVWSSSKPDYLNANGQLLRRPSSGAGDLEVVLTATISKGAASADKTFKVKIKALTGSGGGGWVPSPVIPDPEEGQNGGSNPGGGDPGNGNGNGSGNGSESGGSTTVTLNDIASHWAEAPIKRAVELGFVAGYTDGSFKPDKTVSRDEFVVMLVKALKLQGASRSLEFADAGSIQPWAKPYIAQALASGLVSGYADETFRPKASISRAELAAMVVRGLGLKPAEGSALSYADADQIPAWAKPYVAAAQEAGVMSGRGDNRFAPAATATRAEAAVVILNLLDALAKLQAQEQN
ncbi:beta-N-acetylhexosaminidase [Paenibacillus pinisoli]|uniref:Beta-N-acetylhexosaminidase n=1 Tax=Paenibacillus pinisoli TaxID=1276110 RepID=A0A3A6PEA8_9BACL|nr:S-layer homology domain-containing protein [Paenibacillus pinisoli]RJX39187.1 beta-N-acetylhexosaminidase [Paenibacillus pinisoli]